ncbi:hypothetical protein TKK_0015198 [Trichogramma kaykai]|uniref:Uncharacterized protein n=1 Tax=Trichogramma kaykai TaxID=54128 RepID=A0ABD2WB81_9HYME
MGKKKSESEGAQKKAKDDPRKSKVDQRKSISEKIERLCKCKKILSLHDMHDFGNLAKYPPPTPRPTIQQPCDECKDEAQATYAKLHKALAIPYDPHTFVTVKTDLSACPKFEIRAGTKHMKSEQYSVLSCGFQGVAIAGAAIATSYHLKPTCWNNEVIDQVLDDGDLWFCESYKDIKTSDRRRVTLRDLRVSLSVQNEHQVTLDVGDPVYTGTFRSENMTIMHVARALLLFFDNYSSAVLTSSVLNVAMWRTGNKYNFFDGQARCTNGEVIAKPNEDGDSAKLIIVDSVDALLHFILEKSNVNNESFVIYSVRVGKSMPLDSLPTEEELREMDKPMIRTDGFIVREKYRAVLQGTYHLEHHFIVEELRTRSHLTFALGALIYTKLVQSRNWTKTLLDLILNQSNIYLIDLARALDKRLDETFQLTVDELLGDVILGVYTAKIKVEENVVPGQTKGKVTIDVGIRTFFETYTHGVIELKGIFYAVWRVNHKYYLLDPFACDEDGFRVDPNDEESQEKYKTASACVTMNSSLDQLLEVLMKNNDTKDKDPFVIHGITVLYITVGDGSNDEVIYRDPNTKRRPEPEEEKEPEITECEIVDTDPKPRPQEGLTVEEVIQYPDLMERVDKFITSYEETVSSELVKIKDYKIVNPSRIILRGTKNLSDKDFKPENQGQQGIITAITAVAQGRLSCTTKWDPAVIDQIIVSSNDIYGQLVDHIETYVDFDEMRLSMVPKIFEYQEKQFHFGKRSRVLQGQSNPLANLGEALERYFALYDQLILENKKHHYCIWKRADKYGLFNPYGCDEEGWQNITMPAGLVIVDSIVELVNVLYGTLDYYENDFIIHYFDLIQKSEDDDKEVEMPKVKPFGKFITKFLPLTNDDLADINPEEGVDDDDSVFILFDENDEGQSKKGRCRRIRKKANDAGGLAALLDSEKEEPKQPDPPLRLNLALVTGMVKVEPPVDEEEIYKKNLETYYEKLKYDHPPPFTAPPKKTVCNLLRSKLASKSAHSLLSRFSIDSKLSVKEKIDSDEVATIKSTDEVNKTSLITLPPEKFFYSNRLPNGLTPIRAVDDMFIKNEIVEDKKAEECQLKRREKEIIMVPEEERPSMLPIIIPLGPVIRTPIFIRTPKDCPDKIIRECPISAAQRRDVVMRKLACGTENLLLEIMAPGFNSLLCEKKERLGPCEQQATGIKQEAGEVVKQEADEVTVKQEPGAASLKQEPGAASLKQEPGVSSLKQEPGVKTKQKSGATVKQEPGTTQIKQEPGTTAVKQEPGETDVKQEPEEQISTAQLALILRSELSGFVETNDSTIGIIKAGMSLQDRESSDVTHYKDCFYASMFCIIAKISKSVDKFNRKILDYIIASAQKIGDAIGGLRVIQTRTFHNAILMQSKCNLIISEIRYADPENSEYDKLPIVLCEFFSKHQTGIISFLNASYAFWFADGVYYLFDPYGCDENGCANPAGVACVMRCRSHEAFVARLESNEGKFANQPFRLHSIAISHYERIKSPKKRRVKKCKVKKPCPQPCPQPAPIIQEPEECKPIIEEPDEVIIKPPLIEKIDWLTYDNIEPPQNCAISGFQAIPNYRASALEVDVLENDPTRPILGPMRENEKGEMVRMNTYDREFHERTFLAEPMSLCIMAWAQIYDPAIWSIQTVKGLYEACKEYSADSLFAADDTSVNEMYDDLLTEFNIANYTFRVVFAPLHTGTLYATSGWNLAVSLQRIFDSPIYTGAVLCCKEKFYGVMKRGRRYYAWWLVKWTKSIRIIVTEDLQDYLKLLVKDLDKNSAAEFSMRIVTMSYAVMVGPNCGDVDGLHQSMMPTDSIPQVYRKNPEDYDPKDIFKPIDKDHATTFVRGSVALNERDKVTEPQVKRCYFVALLAVLMKRDLIQNPIPAMVDKIVELGEAIYKLMPEPKYHTSHILKDANLMNRTFEFCDVAYGPIRLQNEKDPGMKDFFTVVRTALKEYFEKRTSGIIHFTNCCYGFWYSEATECYYYLDPYQCNEKGRRVEICGKSCFCVFSTVCDMVHQMCANKSPETSGFFIHEIHVEAVNALNNDQFVEDPIWAYLDYHWSQRHCPRPRSSKKKPGVIEKAKIPIWKAYVIEVPNMIYSVWGSIGTFDPQFDSRAGKNQAAIVVCSFAMRNLCHPAEWTGATLDSIVLAGDTYYKESKNSDTKCQNRFHLSQSLKITPFQWDIEFLPGICGVLYGEKNKRSLSEAVSLGLKRQPQLLLKCGKKFVGILQTTDGYYAVDSSWTGPPLFRKSHGAIYAIRCKNTNILIYVLTKMLNTNQKVRLTVTPLKMDYKQEVVACKSTMPKTRIILMRPMKPAPGRTIEHDSLVSGSVAVPEQDSYLMYNRNLKLGLAHGHTFEMEEMKVEGGCKSKRLKTCGRKRIEPEVDGPYDEGPSILYRKVSLPKQLDLAKYALEEAAALKRQTSLCPEIISTLSENYTVDVIPGVAGMAQICSKVSSKGTCPLMDQPDKLKPDRDCASGIDHYGPIGWKDVEEIDLTNSFIADKTRQEFKKFNQELSKDLYKEEKQMTEQEYNNRMDMLELTSTSNSDCNKTSAPCTQKQPK